MVVRKAIVADAAAAEPLPGVQGASLTDLSRVDGWSDEEIERMAGSDPDHPPLDDEFWQRSDASLSTDQRRTIDDATLAGSQDGSVRILVDEKTKALWKSHGAQRR